MIDARDIVWADKRVGEMDRDELIAFIGQLNHQIAELAIAGGPKPIARNQVIPPRQTPGEDHALELEDGRDDMEYLGPPVVIAPYKPPRDKRVQAMLRDAERQRKAEADRDKPPARKIYTDPRLNPNYKPPKRPPTNQR
jgi:hypothetical protein